MNSLRLEQERSSQLEQNLHTSSAEQQGEGQEEGQDEGQEKEEGVEVKTSGSNQKKIGALLDATQVSWVAFIQRNVSC